MSKKTQLFSEMWRGFHHMGGGYLTFLSRVRTAKQFVMTMRDHGFIHLDSAQDIRGKHLRAYIDARIEDGLALRTMQNHAAHIRTLMRECGNHAAANAPEISNEALGIGGASRKGTKIAIPDDEFNRAYQLAIDHGRPGMAAILGLARELGLRMMEAIRAEQDTLTRWLAEIHSRNEVEVIAGTKGGRRRTVRIMRKDAAVAAIKFALNVAEQQRGRLVVGAMGEATTSLEQAWNMVHSWMGRASIQLHSCRYRFAIEQVNCYLARGFSKREAFMSCALDLGHGDGRGRWVEHVYTHGQFAS